MNRASRMYEISKGLTCVIIVSEGGETKELKIDLLKISKLGKR